MTATQKMQPAVTSDVEEQLVLLRDLTKRTGILHDAQVFQLKMWPLVLFLHAKETEMHVNIEKQEIDFVLTKTKGKAPADMKVRMENLDDWTKWLLGDEWVVRVKHNGKLLYRGGRKIREPKFE